MQRRLEVGAALVGLVAGAALVGAALVGLAVGAALVGLAAVYIIRGLGALTEASMDACLPSVHQRPCV